jgi:hypothetical protein
VAFGMAKTEIRSKQIKDSTINKDDIDITTTGKALITKVVAGSGVTISSTGVDSGTGDVTINASGGSSVGYSKQALTINTTDATPTALLTYDVNANAVVWFRFGLVGRYVNNSANKHYWCHGFGCARDNNGSSSLVGEPILLDGDEGSPGYIAKVDVSGSNLRIMVTGAASEDVAWEGTFEYQEATT